VSKVSENGEINKEIKIVREFIARATAYQCLEPYPYRFISDDVYAYHYKLEKVMNLSHGFGRQNILYANSANQTRIKDCWPLSTADSLS